MPRPAVFLDRDDTLIESSALPPQAHAAGRPGDLADPDFVRLLPGVWSALAALRQSGHALVVVTNQGVVARGGATLDQVNACNQRLLDLLPDPDRPGRSLIDRVYICPWHPQGTVASYAAEHPWRKPQPGMLLAAIEELDLNPAASWLIGDAERDLEAGRRAGLPPKHCLRIGPDGPHADLPDAVAHILRSS